MIHVLSPYTCTSGTISMAKQLYDDAAVHFNSAIRKDVAFFDAYESAYVWGGE